MSNYYKYLQNISSPKTFARKVDYLKYNFGKILKIENQKNIKILEIGPGLGECLHYLNSLNCTNIDIIDNDQSILDNLEKNYKVANSFLAEDISKIKEKLSQYDFIILTQVLEHIPYSQYQVFLNTLYNHLKPKGQIIITVPNLGNPFSIYERYDDITHQTGLTENSLKALVHNCKLKKTIVTIQPFKIPPYNSINFIRIILQKIIHLIIKSFAIMNGGVYAQILTPNITLVIQKQK